MGVDPGKFRLKLGGRAARRPEHPEATRPADRGDHVAAMAERQQGKFDPQQPAKLGVHGLAALLSERSVVLLG
jgi:hypothetical protein